MKVRHCYLILGLMVALMGSVEVIAQESGAEIKVQPESRVRITSVRVGASYQRTCPPYSRFGRYPYFTAWRRGWDPAFCDYWCSTSRGSALPPAGRIKLSANIAESKVFIDGAYAGELELLKTFSLAPGVYDFRLESEGYAPFTTRIYILSGKTLKLAARLERGDSDEN